jgi:hypothetical protein
MKSRILTVAAALLLGFATLAYAGNTVLFSSKSGDVVFPFTPPTSSAPGTIDNMTIGATTPKPATVTTLHATGTSELDGAVSGAGFTSAVQAISAPPITVGTVTLNGATPVTVANAAVDAGSLVIFTLKTVGGTVGAYPAIQTITPATGFTVAGTALDTSVYNYAILK